jgi:hypothetical protein
LGWGLHKIHHRGHRGTQRVNEINNKALVQSFKKQVKIKFKPIGLFCVLVLCGERSS